MLSAYHPYCLYNKTVLAISLQKRFKEMFYGLTDWIHKTSSLSKSTMLYQKIYFVKKE